MTKVYKSVRGIQAALARHKKASVGFVPTMGALHAGHISLVEAAKKKDQIVVVSIFVNPTQFNEKSDLDKYPRTFKADLALLKKNDVDYLFFPSVRAVYPARLDTKVDLDLGLLDKVMEGEHRPGHFDGVMEVVNRLLDIIEPAHLYMGQKDFQQFTIIQHMIDALDKKTKLVVCPILREASGLAMSSRNVRLTEEYKMKATILHQCLLVIKKQIDSISIKELIKQGIQKIEKAGLKPEYIDIIDGNSLQAIEQAKDHEYIAACLAAWAGDVRLIDNIILKSE